MLRHLDTLRQDLTYAFRQLRHNPGYALVALCSLAAGIGANVSIYSGAWAFLQRPPEAAHPEELVRVYRGSHSPLGRDWFLELSRRSRTLRTALGATRGDVMRLVMGDTLVLVLTGLGLGIAAGMGSGAAVSRWLYGVGALDPLPLAGATVVLLVVALLGTWVPARRALAVDPQEALRAE